MQEQKIQYKIYQKKEPRKNSGKKRIILVIGFAVILLVTNCVTGLIAAKGTVKNYAQIEE